MNRTTRCWIYRSSRKQEMYLYLPAENNFAEIPSALMSQFGTPKFVMELELNPALKLARADAVQVIAKLKDAGYFLQLPPDFTPDMYHGNDV